MQWIGAALGAVMRLCYQWVQNYGLAVILFTILSKIILFPVSLWVHQNGIKMVRMQARINRIKIRHFGDGDAIAEEQGKLYKQEQYNPFLGVVPIFVQLFLLIGLIQVIYHPLSYILQLPQDLCQAVIGAAHQLGGIDAASGSAELLALDYVQKAADLTAFAALPGMTQEILNAMLRMNMSFLGFHLSGVPVQDGGVLLLIPALAGLASVVLSLSQNVMNPLQREQGRAEQMGSMLFSVGLSLVLGFFIPAGVGFYWIWSNLFTIAQQAVLNLVYRPEKHIDYAELADSKKELAQYQSVGKAAGKRSKQDVQREKADYKRFFSIVNKHLVFYSERSGYYKYFEGVITCLLRNTNLTIHYVTSDPQDGVFELAKKEERLLPYYIGEKKLITLFMKMDADVVVMTMPEIEKYHYKRSLVRKDIEYIYIFHAMVSTHMIYRKSAFDSYDTIFLVGPHHHAEILETEALYGLPPKKLVEFGYPLLDTLRDDYAALPKGEHPYQILIAPSHHEGNIMDSCLHELLNALLEGDWQIVVRPHPQYIRRNPTRVAELKERYQGHANLRFEDNFASSESIYQSDVLITDWSGISMEYSFTTLKPCIFINTPVKILNPDYTRYKAVPALVAIRNQIGVSVDLDQVGMIASHIQNIRNGQLLSASEIAGMVDHYVYNVGTYGKPGAEYIIKAIQSKIKKRNRTN